MGSRSGSVARRPSPRRHPAAGPPAVVAATRRGGRPPRCVAARRRCSAVDRRPGDPAAGSDRPGGLAVRRAFPAEVVEEVLGPPGDVVLATWRRIARIRRRSSRGLDPIASSMVDLSPLMSYGLTRNACLSSADAPANSLSTSAPLSSNRQATYSLATRFMPSRSGVTTITSAARNSAAISLARVRRVQVGDRLRADVAEVAVDAPHQPVDVVAEHAVLLDALARRRGHLDERDVSRHR